MERGSATFLFVRSFFAVKQGLEKGVNDFGNQRA